jgi:hypothetical protein
MLRERGLRLVVFHERELVWAVDVLVGVELQAPGAAREAAGCLARSCQTASAAAV